MFKFWEGGCTLSVWPTSPATHHTPLPLLESGEHAAALLSTWGKSHLSFQSFWGSRIMDEGADVGLL